MKLLTFSEVYEGLLKDALGWPVSLNKRTGAGIHIGRGAESFKLDLTNCCLPLPRLRKIHARSAAAEVAWFLRGERDVEWIANYAPLWNQFAEDDGTIKAAYGYRWRQFFGRDQILLAIEALKNDDTDRRIYISAWDPCGDGLGAKDQKNVPCPVGFTLSIVGGLLHSSLMIRSSDLFVGLPYDVLGHAMLMSAFCGSLGVMPGTMTVTLAHPHLYVVHDEMVRDGRNYLAVEEPNDPWMPALNPSVEDIIADPEGYVETVTKQARSEHSNWPTYNPRPEVVK